MSLDIWSLFALMLRSRLFEEAIAKLWHNGLSQARCTLELEAITQASLCVIHRPPFNFPILRSRL